MKFNSKKEVTDFIKNMVLLDDGSQSIAYYHPNDGKMYKIYHDFFECYKKCSYDKMTILRFSKYSNSTIIFPEDTLDINNKTIGYTRKYVGGNLLCETVPDDINYNDFTNAVYNVFDDIKYISDNHIRMHDVIYNTMYDGKKIFIIDTDDYAYSSMEINELYYNNCLSFNAEVKQFIVNNYLDEFILGNRILKELYRGKENNIKEFLEHLKQFISEYIGKEFIYYKDAKPCFNKNEYRGSYIRLLKNK